MVHQTKSNRTNAITTQYFWLEQSMVKSEEVFPLQIDTESLYKVLVFIIIPVVWMVVCAWIKQQTSHLFVSALTSLRVKTICNIVFFLVFFFVFAQFERINPLCWKTNLNYLNINISLGGMNFLCNAILRIFLPYFIE